MTKLDLLTDADLKREPKPKKAPPKRWRNLWWIPEDWSGFDPKANLWIKGPTEYWSVTTYPSKDIAESVALKYVRINAMRHPELGVRYLGAHPVDTDPKS